MSEVRGQRLKVRQRWERKSEQMFQVPDRLEKMGESATHCQPADSITGKDDREGPES
jgi:hypothetical protein